MMTPSGQLREIHSKLIGSKKPFNQFIDYINKDKKIYFNPLCGNVTIYPQVQSNRVIVLTENYGLVKIDNANMIFPNLDLTKTKHYFSSDVVVCINDDNKRVVTYKWNEIIDDNAFVVLYHDKKIIIDTKKHLEIKNNKEMDDFLEFSKGHIPTKDYDYWKGIVNKKYIVVYEDQTYSSIKGIYETHEEKLGDSVKILNSIELQMEIKRCALYMNEELNRNSKKIEELNKNLTLLKKYEKD